MLPFQAGAAAFLMASLTAANAFATDKASQRAVDQSRKLIESRLAAGHPGFSVAVARHGELLWSEGFGVADLESGTPVTTETLFRIGSTSKAFTGAAAGRLFARGLIDFDADVRSLYPDFPEKEHAVRLRHLFTHQAGIRHYRGLESFNRKHYDSVADGLAIFASEPLEFRPGSKTSYSSYGFNLAGAALAHVAELSFAELLASEITEPLGLTATQVDDPTRPVPGIATFYSKRSKGMTPAVTVDDSYKAPSGGLLSTPTDVATFGAELLRAHAGQSLWLSAEVVRKLFTPLPLDDGEPTIYALGFRSQLADPKAEPPRRFVVHHGGSSIGARSMLLMYPDEGLVVALQCNSDAYDTKEKDASEIAGYFRDALADE